jgi:hypothetical protein
MDDAKRSVNSFTRDFLAAWWRGDAGPVPCGGCSACCYYDGIPVDNKRDRRRLPTCSPSGTPMADWCSSDARTAPALTSGRSAVRSTSTGHRPAAASTAAPSRRWD